MASGGARQPPCLAGTDVDTARDIARSPGMRMRADAA